MNIPIYNEEQYPSKVEAVFDNENDARIAQREVTLATDVLIGETQIITPDERNWSKQIEPEADTLIESMFLNHVIYGLSGLAIASLLAMILIFSGVNFAFSSPIITTFVFMFVGGMMGMMIAGLLTLRPDHDNVIQRARHALKKGKVVLLVHIKDRPQLRDVELTLSHLSPKVASTL